MFLLSGEGAWLDLRVGQINTSLPTMQLCTVCLGASHGDGFRQLVTPARYKNEYKKYLIFFKRTASHYIVFNDYQSYRSIYDKFVHFINEIYFRFLKFLKLFQKLLTFTNYFFGFFSFHQNLTENSLRFWLWLFYVVIGFLFCSDKPTDFQ